MINIVTRTPKLDLYRGEILKLRSVWYFRSFYSNTHRRAGRGRRGMRAAPAVLEIFQIFRAKADASGKSTWKKTF